MLVRPCRQEDLDALIALAAKAGRGLTTVPRTTEAMAARIDASIQSFAKAANTLTAETYMLVLEEDNGDLSGISAIYTNLGYDQPFYSYRLSRHAAVAPEINVRADVSVMSLVNDFHGYAELGTLFLDPDRRGGGRGTLLSFSRFMLMAAMPDQFGDHIMAEMRGWTDDQGRSPFWEALGRKFFHMEFADADALSGISNRFIADLMPKVPIYTALLPDDAQAVIGKTHDQTLPARRLLEKQGFRFENQVDVFDGGPCLEARRMDIPVVRGAADATLATLPYGQPGLVSAGTAQAFRVMYAADSGTLAKGLDISDTEPLLFSPIG